MSVVHRSEGVLPPASAHLMSEPKIICELAKVTLGEKTKAEWEKMADNYDLIRDKIEACVIGFTNYNERVRKKGGFYLPIGASEKNFTTPSRKAQFTVNQVTTKKLKTGEFLMTTLRSHDQFNTTIYGNEDRYRGIANGRRIAMMNKEDLKMNGLQSGDVIDLIGNYKGVERIAPHFTVVEYNIPTKNIATYFPEANILVPIDQYAKTHTPASKSVVISIRKHIG